MSFKTGRAEINQVVEILFEAERRRTKKTISDLIQANNEAWGISFDGFLYGGSFLTDKEGNQRSMRKGSLHYSLDATMINLEKAQREIESDATAISQILYRVWDCCEENHVIPFIYSLRDNIPDCIVQFIPILRGIPRDKEIGSIFSNSKEGQQNKKQLLSLTEKMEYYYATRLIY